MATEFADGERDGHHDREDSLQRGDGAGDAHRTGRHCDSLPARYRTAVS